MEKEQQSNGISELTGTLCNLFLIVLLVALPLYTEGNYWRLGDKKYLLYRNSTLLCVGLFLVLAVYQGIKNKAWQNRGKSLSIVDKAMLLYAGCVLLSLLSSAWPGTAWNGYVEWYMGALTQFLLVAGYFLVSRCYQGAAAPIRLGEAALLAVVVTGLLQRLGFYPFGLLEGYGIYDWEHSHMLSTVGNINWLCGYMSVLLPLCVSGFLYASPARENRGKPWLLRYKQLWLGAVTLLSILLLCIQGGDSGLLLVLVCMAAIFISGIKRRNWFRKGLALLLGLSVLIPMMSWLMNLRDAMGTMPPDGRLCRMVLVFPWWLFSIPLLLFYQVFERLTDRNAGRVSFIFVGIHCLMGAVAAGCYLRGFVWSNEWGSGRGGLWRLALEGFGRADWRQKLLGAGPDCFAEYIYSTLPVKNFLQISGHWSDAIFTNAHNEWLNNLVNLGILGTLAYLGIFAAAWKRYKGIFLGRLLLLLYGIHSMISFQQVLNAPCLFLLLGLCEYRCRKEAGRGPAWMGAGFEKRMGGIK